MSNQPRRQWPRSTGMIWALLGAALALLIAGAIWLRASPPAAGGHRQTVYADGLRVTLQLDSAALGERVVEVLIDDEAGRPVEVEAVRLRFSMTEMDMGVADVAAQPAGRGRFQARGPFFSMAGRWAVEAIVQREAQAPLPVTFSFPISGPGETSDPLNPLVADAATLAAGRRLYQSGCASCHGDAGRGDGPSATGLRPAPADFTEHMVAGKHSDGQVYAAIRDGVPGSAMPAWGERLSDEQIWQLVTYLRTFAPATPAAQGEPAQTPDASAAVGQPTAGAPAATAEATEPLPPLVFTREGNLWRSDGSGAAPRPLTQLEEGSYAQYPALSPAGDRVAFVITSQGPLGEDEWPQLNPETRLAVVGLDGSGLQLLWDPERGVLGQAAWAPDGQGIYVSVADVLSEPGAAVPDRRYQIVRVDPITGERAVALEDAYDLWFAPDGRLAAFLRWNRELARFRLSVAAPDGAGEREVVAGRGFVTFASPRFSPDGRQILFVSPGGPPTDEQGYPITQGRQSPLERALALFEPPAAEAHGSAADLWVVNVDGTGLRRLTTLRADSPMGIFTPNGERIVVLAAEGIYTLSADGSDLRRLDPAGDHGGLDWGQR